MKKLLMVGILLSSIFTVGCNNDKERKFAKELLDLIDGNGNIAITVNSGCGYLVDPNMAVDKGGCSCVGLVDTNVDGIDKGISCPGPDRIYPGIGYEVVDHWMENDGHVVLRKLREVTSSDGSTVYNYEYIGVDLTEWEDLQGFLNSDAPWSAKASGLKQFFSYNFEMFGYLQLDPNDHRYKYQTDEGNWVNFSESSQIGKDLELMGSRIEDGNAEVMGEKLSNKYGLSVDRGQEVAKTMAAYNSLVSKRALTSREENFFSNTLLGVDYDAAKNGLTGGDSEDFDALMNRAAEVNGTTPEQVGAIVNEMFL